MVPTTYKDISLTILFLLVLCELSWVVTGTGLEDNESGSNGCPKICGLPPEGGPCLKRKRFRMWYYDVGAQECRRFSYGGCRGNKNRFWTEEECRASCENCMLKTKQDEVVAEREKLQGEVCQLYPADHGKCDTANVRPSIKWSFNPSTELCEPFAYTGCGGNANRFESQHQCEEACGNQN